jgi:hypothetical protein
LRTLPRGLSDRIEIIDDRSQSAVAFGTGFATPAWLLTLLDEAIYLFSVCGS